MLKYLYLFLLIYVFYFIIYLFFFILFANNLDPDVVSHDESPLLGLNCLSASLESSI